MLEFANGSRLVGIPEGRTRFAPITFGACSWMKLLFNRRPARPIDAAVPVCEKIVVVSSAGPGWFADFVTDSL
jgi:hypothetical protein